MEKANRIVFCVRWHDEHGTQSEVHHTNQNTAIMEGKRSKKFKKYSFDVMRLELEWHEALEKWDKVDWWAVTFVGIDGGTESYE